MVSPSYDIITDFREHGGHVTSGPFVDKPLLLLTTIGARTHERRTSALIYSRDGDRYVVVASKGGAPHHPSWYHNLLASPVVEIEVDGRQLLARASVADPGDRRRLYDQQIAILPGFAEYERRTTRQIPVVLLEPIPGQEGTAAS